MKTRWGNKPVSVRKCGSSAPAPPPVSVFPNVWWLWLEICNNDTFGRTLLHPLLEWLCGRTQESANFCRRPHPLLCSTTVSLHAAGYNWSSAQIKSHNHAPSRTQSLKHTHARMFGKIVHITNTLLRIKCAFFTPFFCLFKQLKSQHANETKFTV